MGTRVLLLALFVAASFAGCTDTGGEAAAGTGIKIASTPADPLSEAYVFEATKSADEYRWDFGDGTKGTGETVEHVFGVQNGEFKVKLTTVTGGEEETHNPLTVTIGSGENTPASFRLDLEWQWVQVGEEVTFSAAQSSDPEGDRLLFNWFCTNKGSVNLQGAGHAHPSVGVEFGSGSAATVPISVLNGTDVPAADRQVDGDMCDNINAGAFTPDATIRGQFSSSGVYSINMLAKDPANPSVSAEVLVFVTDDPRENGTKEYSFSDTIQYGAPPEFDQIGAQADMQDHIRVHDFEVKYPIVGMEASISDDGGTGGVSEVQYEIRKGDTTKWGPTSDPLQRSDDYLSPGQYKLFVYLRSGAEVTYDVDMTLYYQTDPNKLFEAGAH